MEINNSVKVRGFVVPETTVVYPGQVNAILRHLIDVDQESVQVYCSFPAEKAAQEVATRLKKVATSIALSSTPTDHVDFFSGYFEHVAGNISDIVIIGVDSLVRDAMKAFAPDTSAAMKDIKAAKFVPGWCFKLSLYPENKKIKKRIADFTADGYFNFPAEKEPVAA